MAMFVSGRYGSRGLKDMNCENSNMHSGKLVNGC